MLGLKTMISRAFYLLWLGGRPGRKGSAPQWVGSAQAGKGIKKAGHKVSAKVAGENLVSCLESGD